MKRFIMAVMVIVSLDVSAKEYESCNDSRYIDYVNKRLDFYSSLTEEEIARAYESLEDPQEGLDERSAEALFLYQIVTPAAQHRDKNYALAYIERYEADALQSNAQRFANTILNRKPNLAIHTSKTARAWLAYRDGDIEGAKALLLESVDIGSSPVLSSFGPDLSLVRTLYNRHDEDAFVLAYLEKTKSFWHSGKSKYLPLWEKMIANNCLIQFQFYDTTSTEGFDWRQ